jgi:hypothetical protein
MTEKTENGERKPENGVRKPENGDRRPENGERKTENGNRKNGKLTIENGTPGKTATRLNLFSRGCQPMEKRRQMKPQPQSG